MTTSTAVSPAVVPAVAPALPDEPGPVGRLLRGWRERRMLTQLELALRAGVSARHLSFAGTGRSRPTSEMILRLAHQLDVPLRERNVLLLSGGYAPAFPVSRLPGPAARRPPPARIPGRRTVGRLPQV